MPLEKFPAFFMQSSVEHMQATEVVTGTWDREPGLSLAAREVSENQFETTAALDPVRLFDVGLKCP